MKLDRFFAGSSLVMALAASEPSNLSVLIDDQFEKNAAASRVDGWSGSYKVEQVDGVKCLFIVTADNQSCERKFPAVKGVAEFDFTVQTAGPGLQAPSPYLRSGGKNVIKLAFVNASWRSTGPEGSKTLTKKFQAGEWVRLRVVADFRNQRFDAYLGEDPVGTAIPFAEAADSIDNATFKVSVRSFKVLHQKWIDPRVESARQELRALREKIAAPLASHPAPLAGVWAAFALDAAAQALDRDDLAYGAACAAEAQTLLALKTVRRTEPSAVLCPPVPEPLINPCWAALCEKWNKQVALNEKVEVRGYPDKIAAEAQSLALALCHPQSPRRGDPAALRRLLVNFEVLMQQWAMGKNLADFACDQEIPQVYLLLRTVYPDLLTPARRARWEALIRSNADLIVSQHGEVYRNQRQEALWINSDVRHAVSLAWSAQILGNGEYRRLGDEAMTLISRALQPDGGFAYVGFQNEAFSYHGETPIAQTWYHLATGSPTVKAQLVAARNYFPLTWHPRGIGDYTLTTMMKQYWNMGRPDTAALLAAWQAGDGYNLTIGELGRGGRTLSETNASPLAAFAWRADLAPKPIPDGWLLLDRNTIGPRGRYGDFTFSASTRDPSAVTAAAQDWDGKLIGNFTSGFVGAIALESEDAVSRALAANPNATDRRFPLSAALQNVMCEVKVEKGPDVDISRRAKHRFMAQNQRNGVTLGNDYSAIGTVYKITDKITGGDSTFKPLPWEGRQVWLLTPGRLVGLLSITALGPHENWGVHGTLMLVGGREGWGAKRTLSPVGPASWTYGNLSVNLLAHDFAAVSTEYTDAFTGTAKKSARLLLWDKAGGVEAETLTRYEVGSSRYWLVEIKPAWAPAAGKIKRLEGLPEGLWGFELVEAKRMLRVVHNFTGVDKRYSEAIKTANVGCSAHRSVDHGMRFRNLATSLSNTDRSTIGGRGAHRLSVTEGVATISESIPAWGHVIVVCSDDPAAHLQNNQVYEDVFK
jgi:hypothetical protein